MGVERAVTRWYARRQLILNEIAQLEAQLVAVDTGAEAGNERTKLALQEQLARTRKKLLLLGPCPQSAMV
jgi:hypothetical protein